MLLRHFTSTDTKWNQAIEVRQPQNRVKMAKMKFSAQIKEYLGCQFNLPEEQVELMMPEFKKTLSGHMENLERVHQQDSLDDLAKAAHTIKGAFLNLGLVDCAELAKQIEGGAVSEDTTLDYEALITDMGAIVDDILNEQ